MEEFEIYPLEGNALSTAMSWRQQQQQELQEGAKRRAEVTVKEKIQE